MLNITIDGMTKEYHRGVTFEAIAGEYQEAYDNEIVLVTANRKIRELHKKVEKDAELSFVTLRDDVGHKTYVRTASMLLAKAACDISESPVEGRIGIEFSVGQGYYCVPRGSLKPDRQTAEKIKARMWELIHADLKISKTAYPIDEAIEIFKSQGMKDKVKLFRYRRGSYINVYCMDGYYDYNYGYMLPSTGYMKYFDLIPYHEGFMLVLPHKSTPKLIEPFKPSEKLFEALLLSEKWGADMGIETVGDLNNRICEGDLAELILVQEAFQERRIAEIAKQVVKSGDVKFVMIAGPSSSGKTTFSHRLSIQLQTLGLKPHPIAVDDYFVEREKTPRDENGEFDFECLESIDLESFNNDMLHLLEGREVEIPSFNFKTGHREYKGNFKRLGKDDILVIEGIHGLNDKMSHSLPVESKFKIYISALTTLNIDGHNRIPTTDGRLLRRMVRDARTRGASARRTLEMWPSVRRGEEKNIFPFQESADAMFNSALIYELAVLKQFAEPLLYSIPKSAPEYFESKRLLKFLEYFLGVSSEDLPNNSIVREFVGGSCFRV